MAEVVLADAGGGTVAVRTGDRLVVRLAENPTTGYRWAVEEADATFLTLEASSFEPPSGSTPGAGGWRTFRFLAVGPGATRLRLAARRARVGGEDAGQSFAVTVHVA